MTWRTHLMGGVAILWMLPVGLASSTASAPLALLLAALGSLLPDLDARESKLSSVQVGGIAPLKPVARLLNRRLGHRGVLHSLLALLALSLLVGLPLSLFLDPLAGLGLALGYLSHLLLDACTRSGVPLLWPERRKLWVLPPRLRLVTGSMAEEIAFLLLATIGTGFLLTQLAPRLYPFTSSPSLYEPDPFTSSPASL